ncbi:hypothetical protein GW756_04115 [bacterium]|nr:hypothetical protein [bacterium]NCQ55213.1 hypothetical protein [Candidatus Parcubacteria bacterium]NCS67274.1 hypothetical protein [Candidatus Peregrinibacteria bacterium]NCS96529.1 hypothetical protein [bacterium]
MKKPQIVYIHGGDGFDSLWPALKVWSEVLIYKASKLFKPKSAKWPDHLTSDLPDFEVLKLKMPTKYNAKYKAWVNHFESQFPLFNDEVILLGWSLGANFLVKYLAENDFPKKVKAAHLVAGCYGLGGGFELSHNFPGKLSNYNVTLYHSKDDFVVKFEDFQKYREKLPQAKTEIFEDRNHFLQSDFPELLLNLNK